MGSRSLVPAAFIALAKAIGAAIAYSTDLEGVRDIVYTRDLNCRD